MNTNEAEINNSFCLAAWGIRSESVFPVLKCVFSQPCYLPIKLPEVSQQTIVPNIQCLTCVFSFLKLCISSHPPYFSTHLLQLSPIVFLHLFHCWYILKCQNRWQWLTSFNDLSRGLWKRHCVFWLKHMPFFNHLRIAVGSLPTFSQADFQSTVLLFYCIIAKPAWSPDWVQKAERLWALCDMVLCNLSSLTHFSHSVCVWGQLYRF